MEARGETEWPPEADTTDAGGHTWPDMKLAGTEEVNVQGAQYFYIDGGDGRQRAEEQK